MSWLSVVPGWAWWVLALGLVGGGQQLRVESALTDLAASQLEFSNYKTEVAEAARAAEAAARSEEQRRAVAVEGIRTDAQEKIKTAQTAAADADAVARRLRQQLERLAGRLLAGDPGSAGGGEAAGGTCLVLAELFERADARAGELAAAYDNARIAGEACASAYDALSGPVEVRP